MKITYLSNKRHNLIRIIAAIAATIVFTVSLCSCSTSPDFRLPKMNEYISSSFTIEKTDGRFDEYHISHIDGCDFSEYWAIGFYDGCLYLTCWGNAENGNYEAHTAQLIKYDVRKKETTVIAEEALPPLDLNEPTPLSLSEASRDNDPYDSIIYSNMGYFDDTYFFLKTYSYAKGGGLSKQCCYNTKTGELKEYFTPKTDSNNRTQAALPSRLSYLNGKVYFDDLYENGENNPSENEYIADMYSYSIKSGEVTLEKEDAENPIAYNGDILYYRDGYIYSNSDDIRMFMPNSPGKTDVGGLYGGKSLTYYYYLYDEDEYANGTAVGYFDSKSFERRDIFRSTAEALYFMDLVSTEKLLGWCVGESPVAYADLSKEKIVVMSPDTMEYNTFAEENRLNIVANKGGETTEEYIIFSIPSK